MSGVKKLTVPFPEMHKRALEQMSSETGLSQTQLIILATISMLANYQSKGSAIFADLLNPEHKR